MTEKKWRHHFPHDNHSFDPIFPKIYRSLSPNPLMKSFRQSRAPYAVASGPIWPKFELVRDCMPVRVTSYKFEKDLIKNNSLEKMWRHRFPHYKSMCAFCYHGNQSCVPICTKTLHSLSPTPVILHKI